MRAGLRIFELGPGGIWVSLVLQFQADLRPLYSRKAAQDLREAGSRFEADIVPSAEWYAEVAHSGQVIGRLEKAMPKELAFCDIFVEGTSDGLPKDRTAASLLLAQIPATCGTVKMHFQAVRHRVALDCVDRIPTLRLMCHLYNAWKIADQTMPNWPDLELLWEIQAPERIFAGSRPTNVANAISSLIISLLRRDPQSAIARKRESMVSRGFRRGVIVNYFVDRQVSPDKAVDELQDVLLGPSRGTSNRSRRRAGETQERDLLDILERFSSTFASEMPGFVFDYLSMQKACYALMDGIVSVSLGKQAVQAMTLSDLEMIQDSLPRPQLNQALSVIGILEELKERPWNAETTDANSMQLELQKVSAKLKNYILHGGGDATLRQLCADLGRTDHHASLFSEPRLQRLYGPQRESAWQSLVAKPDETDGDGLPAGGLEVLSPTAEPYPCMTKEDLEDFERSLLEEKSETQSAPSSPDPFSVNHMY